MASVPEQADSAVAWQPRSALIGVLLANRYRVTQPIGHGSTGVVYRAEDLLLNRPVAVRLLVPSLAQNAGLVSRIRARIDRNIKIQQAQPDALINLVDTFDVGMTLEGELYVVTEHLDGDHLASMLERGGPLPWARARHLFIRLAQILQGLHERGVVLGTLQSHHCYAVRNKPKTEAIKIVSTAILDHIAVNLGPSAGAAGSRMARYAAPEQACGEPTDARTDVYSLGIIAYELLTGRVPFMDANPVRLVAQHLHAAPPPLRQLAPASNIPAAVEELVLTALAKAPADRFPSMEAFAAALSAIPEHEAAAPAARITPSAPAKPLASTLPVSSDTLSEPAPPVSSVAAALGTAAPAGEPAPAPAAKIAPSVVMRVLDAPAPAPSPAAPLAPAPPPVAPPPAVGPKRPPTFSMPTLIPPARRPSEPLTAAAVASTLASPAPADKPTASPALTLAPEPAAPAPAAEPAPAPATPEPAPAAAATESQPAPAEPPAASISSSAEPTPPASAPPASAPPTTAPPAAAAEPALVPPPTPVAAAVAAAIAGPAPAPAPEPAPAPPAKPVSSDRSPETAPPRTARPEPPDDDANMSWTAARKAVDAQIAPETIRSAALRKSTERHPALPPMSDAPTESIIAELPRRRFPWVAVIGLGAAIAAGAAAYIQTQPEPLPPGGRAPAQQLPPTAIAQNTPKVVEPRVEPPPPVKPDPVVTPPPLPPPETKVDPVEPVKDPPEEIDEPAGAKKKKKKKKSQGAEPDEEEDLFDQVRKHMEAKKAAEAGIQPQPQEPPPPLQPPAPKPVDDDAAKAKDTLERARQAAAQGNHALAYSLAKQANSLSRSLDALELMGVSACRAGNADNARAAANQLTGAKRTTVVNACSQAGITI